MDITSKSNITLEFDKVKEEIIRTVPATSHPWILPMEAVGYENGIFSVITGQAFAIQIIRKNHYQQILDVFESLGYHLQKFDIIFDEEINHISKRKYKELSNNVVTLKESRELFETLLNKKSLLTALPYLDEIIDDSDDYIVDREKLLTLKRKIFRF